MSQDLVQFQLERKIKCAFAIALNCVINPFQNKFIDIKLLFISLYQSDGGKGLTDINQKELQTTILLFVRERNEDEYKNAMAYVFLGHAIFIDYYGSKPMSIKWELNELMPPYLWKESAKMAIG